MSTSHIHLACWSECLASYWFSIWRWHVKRLFCMCAVFLQLTAPMIVLWIEVTKRHDSWGFQQCVRIAEVFNSACQPPTWSPDMKGDHVKRFAPSQRWTQKPLLNRWALWTRAQIHIIMPFRGSKHTTQLYDPAWQNARNRLHTNTCRCEKR